MTGSGPIQDENSESKIRPPDEKRSTGFEEGIVVEQLLAESRKAVRHVSNLAGLRHLYSFPFSRVLRKNNTVVEREA